jgi:hypothetical protein
MAHMLAKLRGVKAEDVIKILQADADGHAEQGFYLEHLWQNVDDPDEVLFLFQVEDLDHARRFIEEAHAQARAVDPQGNLPHMTFLEEK